MNTFDEVIEKNVLLFFKKKLKFKMIITGCKTLITFQVKYHFSCKHRKIKFQNTIIKFFFFVLCKLLALTYIFL